MKLVPRDTFAFVSVRPADLWARPDLRRLVEELDLPRNVFGVQEKMDTQRLAKNLEAVTGLQPRDIERATLVMRTFEALPFSVGVGATRDVPAGIVLTKAPYDWKKVRKSLEAMAGGTALTEYKSWRLYISGRDQTGFTMCPASDRVLVVGNVKSVKALLDASARDKPGPLDDALALAEKGQPLVIATRIPNDLVAMMVRDRKLAPNKNDLDPLKPARAAILSLALQPQSKGRWLPDLDIDVDLRFRNEEAAGKGLAATRTLAKHFIERIEKDGSGAGLDPLLGPLFRVVRAADWEQQGRSLRLPIRARWRSGDQKRMEAFLKEERLRPQSAINLRKIGEALHKYRQEHGEFPPAVLRSPKGVALYSWRVAILPYTDYAEQYREFHQGRAWDHKANKELLAKMPALFAAPGSKPGNQTYYQAIVGQGAGFESNRSLKFPEFLDGSANILWVVEGGKPVHWASPRDVPFAKGKRPDLGGLFQAGFHGLMVDGSVRMFPRTIDNTILEALCTRAGAESVNLNNFPLMVVLPKITPAVRTPAR